jgi:hypothetical protein
MEKLVSLLFPAITFALLAVGIIIAELSKNLSNIL